MKKTFIQSLESALIELGHENEVNFLLMDVYSKGLIVSEFESGSCIVRLTDKWLRERGYSWMDDYEDVLDEDIANWADFIQSDIFDCTSDEAWDWAVQSIRYILSFEYYGQTKIIYSLSYYINKRAIAIDVDLKDINDAIEMALAEHYSRDFTRLEREIERWT